MNRALNPRRALLLSMAATASLIVACDRRIEPIASSQAAPASTVVGTAAAPLAGQVTTPTAKPPPNKPVSADDVDFIEKAASGNSLELEASKLALERSRNAAVRSFAQHMVDEHSKAFEEMRSLPVAGAVGNFAAMTLKHKDQLARLRELEGAAFDQAYVNQIGVATHQESIALYQKAADNASDSMTKAFAQTKLPVLREHLTMAQSVAQKVARAPTARAATDGKRASK